MPVSTGQMVPPMIARSNPAYDASCMARELCFRIGDGPASQINCNSKIQDFFTPSDIQLHGADFLASVLGRISFANLTRDVGIAWVNENAKNMVKLEQIAKCKKVDGLFTKSEIRKHGQPLLEVVLAFLKDTFKDYTNTATGGASQSDHRQAVTSGAPVDSTGDAHNSVEFIQSNAALKPVQSGVDHRTESNGAVPRRSSSEPRSNVNDSTSSFVPLTPTYQPVVASGSVYHRQVGPEWMRSRERRFSSNITTSQFTQGPEPQVQSMRRLSSAPGTSSPVSLPRVPGLPYSRLPPSRAALAATSVTTSPRAGQAAIPQPLYPEMMANTVHGNILRRQAAANSGQGVTMEPLRLPPDVPYYIQYTNQISGAPYFVPAHIQSTPFGPAPILVNPIHGGPQHHSTMTHQHPMASNFATAAPHNNQSETHQQAKHSDSSHTFQDQPHFATRGSIRGRGRGRGRGAGYVNSAGRIVSNPYQNGRPFPERRPRSFDNEHATYESAQRGRGGQWALKHSPTSRRPSVSTDVFPNFTPNVEVSPEHRVTANSIGPDVESVLQLRVHYLPSDSTPEQLKAFIEQTVAVAAVYPFKLDKNDNSYTFVKFFSTSDARKGLQELNGKTFKNSTLRVQVGRFDINYGDQASPQTPRRFSHGSFGGNSTSPVQHRKPSSALREIDTTQGKIRPTYSRQDARSDEQPFDAPAVTEPVDIERSSNTSNGSPSKKSRGKGKKNAASRPKTEVPDREQSVHTADKKEDAPKSMTGPVQKSLDDEKLTSMTTESGHMLSEGPAQVATPATGQVVPIPAPLSVPKEVESEKPVNRSDPEEDLPSADRSKESIAPVQASTSSPVVDESSHGIDITSGNHVLPSSTTNEAPGNVMALKESLGEPNPALDSQDTRKTSSTTVYGSNEDHRETTRLMSVSEQVHPDPSPKVVTQEEAAPEASSYTEPTTVSRTQVQESIPLVHDEADIESASQATPTISEAVPIGDYEPNAESSAPVSPVVENTTKPLSKTAKAQITESLHPFAAAKKLQKEAQQAKKKERKKAKLSSPSTPGPSSKPFAGLSDVTNRANFALPKPKPTDADAKSNDHQNSPPQSFLGTAESGTWDGEVIPRSQGNSASHEAQSSTTGSILDIIPIQTNLPEVQNNSSNETEPSSPRKSNFFSQVRDAVPNIFTFEFGRSKTSSPVKTMQNADVLAMSQASSASQRSDGKQDSLTPGTPGSRQLLGRRVASTTSNANDFETSFEKTPDSVEAVTKAAPGAFPSAKLRHDTLNRHAASSSLGKGNGFCRQPSPSPASKSTPNGGAPVEQMLNVGDSPENKSMPHRVSETLRADQTSVSIEIDISVADEVPTEPETLKQKNNKKKRKPKKKKKRKSAGMFASEAGPMISLSRSSSPTSSQVSVVSSESKALIDAKKLLPLKERLSNALKEYEFVRTLVRTLDIGNDQAALDIAVRLGHFRDWREERAYGVPAQPYTLAVKQHTDEEGRDLLMKSLDGEIKRWMKEGGFKPQEYFLLHAEAETYVSEELKRAIATPGLSKAAALAEAEREKRQLETIREASRNNQEYIRTNWPNLQVLTDGLSGQYTLFHNPMEPESRKEQPVSRYRGLGVGSADRLTLDNGPAHHDRRPTGFIEQVEATNDNERVQRSTIVTPGSGAGWTGSSTLESQSQASSIQVALPGPVPLNEFFDMFHVEAITPLRQAGESRSNGRPTWKFEITVSEKDAEPPGYSSDEKQDDHGNEDETDGDASEEDEAAGEATPSERSSTIYGDGTAAPLQSSDFESLDEHSQEQIRRLMPNLFSQLERSG